MKQNFLHIALTALTIAATSYIADGQTSGPTNAKRQTVEPATAWTTLSPLGLREPAPIDTLLYNYFRESVPSAVSNAYATTGNLGCEGLNMIFAQRPERSDFFFHDPLAHWLPDLNSHKFYNSRIPMTLLSYNTGGGRDNEQNRLKAIFSGNATRQIQVGGLVDYLYSKGSYNYQALSDFVWGLSGSYTGDRYQLQASFTHWNSLNKENGGITDSRYITDPAELQGGDPKIDAKSIPTRLTSAHTRVAGSQLYLNNRYNVGHWRSEMVDDTTEVRTYIPVISFVWTFDYRREKHLFLNDNRSEADEFWENRYLSAGETRDLTRFWNFTNVAGVEMIEGFHRNIPFGLSVFAKHEVRRYTLPADTLSHMAADRPEDLTPWPEGLDIRHAKTENLLWVGAQLTRIKGGVIKFDATADVGVLGPAIGQFKLKGNVSGGFPLLGDTATVAGYARFDNVEAPYLMRNYISNHFVWKNDFGKQRTLNFGGRLYIGRSGTSLDVGMTNLQNYVYFGSDGLPRQHGDNVQVFSASLNQNFHVGILHWNNSLTYQTSSDDNILALPKFVVYSNLYLLFKVAKVLTVQLGVDCDYYTRYYAPVYQPATMGFCNQNSTMIGNYPFMNAYINMKLSKARFYVMFSHVNQGWFGNDYFSMPDYPLNPRRFQLGVSVDFAN